MKIHTAVGMIIPAALFILGKITQKIWGAFYKLVTE